MTDIGGAPVDGDWAAIAAYDDYYVVAEWRRGEPAPRLVQHLRGVRAVREAVTRAVAEHGTARPFYVRHNGHWLGAVSAFTPEWLPDEAYGATQ